MIKLYSTDCPRCKVLEKKLEEKGVEFEKITNFDVQEFLDEGLLTAPILQVEESYMNFTAAVGYLNNL